MTDGKELLSEELLHQVEHVARAQNRLPAEILEEAVRQYLERQIWVRFVEKNESRTRAKGIDEGDVDRLISEVRRENEERGR
jgi:predicted transcriptional regulator